MDQNDENFFEQLVGAKAGADETYEVELAKAASGTVASRAKRAEGKQVAYNEPAEAETREDDGTPEGSLIVDVYQTPDEIVVQSAIAGVKPEDIDISATSDKITIRGTRHHEKEVRDEDYLCQECYWGRFVREIILPQEIDPEEATVSFKNGILSVRLPKATKKKIKKLQVRAD
jgi:HSP20 family protein